MNLVRAEVWWFWHAMLSFLSYRTGVIMGADWVFLVVYIIGSWAFLSWIAHASTNTAQRCITAFLAHAPALLVSIFGLLALSGVLASDIQIVCLQLTAAIYYPVALLSPEATIGNAQLYLWVLNACLLSHCIACILLTCLTRRRSSNGNSYDEDAENMRTITMRQNKDSIAT